MDEFDLIKKYFTPLASDKAALGLKDDAAIVKVPEGHELVVTKDAIVEGVHFIGDESPDLIARKLLRVNLSDLAAMGAKPYGYFLALMLPKTVNEDWIKAFASGLQGDQNEFGITLLGGDTVATGGALSMSITAMGFVPAGKALKRSGAKAGDDIYVTGTIGDAAIGLRIVSGGTLPPSALCAASPAKSSYSTPPRPHANAEEYLIERYRLPQPRVKFGQLLQGIATSCIDISDGLMQDLGHIAECSNVGATIDWNKIPLSEAAKRILPEIPNHYEAIAAGGDDYELLFTTASSDAETLNKLAERSNVKITFIGKIQMDGDVKLLHDSGKEINLGKKGFKHFC